MNYNITYLFILFVLLVSIASPVSIVLARGGRIVEQPLTTISYGSVNFTVYRYYLVAETNDTMMYVFLRWYPFTPIYQWFTRQGNNVYVLYKYENIYWGITIYAKVTYHFMDPGIAKISVVFSSNKPATKDLPYMLYFVSYAEERGAGKRMVMHMHRHGRMRGWDKPTAAVAGRVFFDWSDMVRAGMKPVLNVTTSYAQIMALWVNWTGTTKTIDPVVGVLNGTRSFLVNETALYESGSGTITIPTTATTYTSNGLQLTVSIGTTDITFSTTLAGSITAYAYAQYTLATPIDNVYKISVTSDGASNYDTSGHNYATAYFSDGTSSTWAMNWGTGTTTLTLSEPKTWTGIRIGITSGTYSYAAGGYWKASVTVKYYTASNGYFPVNVTEYYTVYSTSNATYSYLVSVPWINTTAYPLINDPSFNLTVPAGYDLVAIDNSTGAIISYTVYNDGVNKTYTFTINNTLAPLRFWVNFTAWNSVTLLNTTNGYQYFSPGSSVNLISRLIDPYQNPINGTNITYIIYINGTKAQEFNVTTDLYGWGNTTLVLSNIPNTRIDVETLYNGTYLGLKNITLYTTDVNIYTNISSLPNILIPEHTYIITGNASLTINDYVVPLMINGSGQIYYLTPTVGGNQTFTFQLWSYYQAINVTRYVSVSRIVGDYMNTSTIDVEFIGGKPVIRGMSLYTRKPIEYLSMNWTTNGTIAYSPSISWILNRTLKLNIYRTQIWTTGEIMAWADNHTMSITVDNTKHQITFILHGPCLLKVYVGNLGVPRRVIYDYQVTTNWWYNATEQVLYIPVNGTIVTLDYSSIVSSSGGGGGGGVIAPPAEAEPVKPPSQVVGEPVVPGNPAALRAGLGLIVLSVIGIALYSKARRQRLGDLWMRRLEKRFRPVKWKRREKWWE